MYVNPYQAAFLEEGEWLKANFHVHASINGRGGIYELPNVVKMYKEADYDVLTISGQNYFADTGEVGKENQILTINGIEYIEEDGILCIGINEFIRGEPQAVIDECARQGGFSVISHPNWISEEGLPPALPRETLKQLRGYTGIEILTPGIFRFKGSGLATDVWDEFLTDGKLIWGFANDDFHKLYNFDKAWNVFYSKERSYESIKAAVQRGAFYASTGLTLMDFSFTDGTIKISANFTGDLSKNMRYEFIGANGEKLHECNGEIGEYTIRGDELYVRVQAASEHGAMLWTQPIYQDDKLKPI